MVVAIRVMTDIRELVSRGLPYGESLLQSCTIVIVGGSTPEIGSDALATYKHFLTVDIEIINPSRPFADGDSHVCSFHLDVCLCLGDLWSITLGSGRESGVEIGAHHHLIFGERLSLVDKRFSVICFQFPVLRFKIEGEGNLSIGVHSFQVGHLSCQEWRNDLLSCLRSNAVEILFSITKLRFAVNAQTDVERSIVGITEEILVVYSEFSVVGIHILNPQVLIIISHLMCMRIKSAVGSNQSVAVEVVVACGITSVVTTVSENPASGYRTHVSQTLVNEVPYISSLIFGIFAYYIPIFLESTH